MSPGGVALILAELARRGHLQPEMRLQTFPWKDKSTAPRAIRRPTTARKRSPQGEKGAIVRLAGVQQPTGAQLP